MIAVLGNHDHWSGADEVQRALERGGVEVLRNRHTTITLRHERLQVVGLDDAYTGHARRDEAVKGLRHDLPCIGLSHIAEEADGLWRHGVPLVLSGHTHGGQVTLARLHELAVGRIAGHQYVHGLYGSRRHAGQRATATSPQGAVYVGAGIGAAVVPFRLGDRGKREVTMFELGCEPGDFVEHHAEQEPLHGRKPTQRTIAKRAAAVMRKRLRRERACSRPDDCASPRRARDLRSTGVMAMFHGHGQVHVAGSAVRLRRARAAHLGEDHAAPPRQASPRLRHRRERGARGARRRARAKNDFSQIAALERALAFNVSGHVLHSLFWQNLAPQARGGEPSGALADADQARLRRASRAFRGSSPAPP